MTPEKEQIVDLLKNVIDPELAVNIIDLGLVYDIRVDEASKKVAVDMTLTSPGCPLGDAITEEVYYVVHSALSGFDVYINLVWDPPWSTDRMTQAGREALGR